MGGVGVPLITDGVNAVSNGLGVWCVNTVVLLDLMRDQFIHSAPDEESAQRR